ncbi:energy transducer TonB [Paraflavisolibacter sp. H34]|uniref:energy transducer TonB n=1 Tax=Huijunlia imazamoxiresistens TaxID=3127457 RepID=UPI003016B1CD
MEANKILSADILDILFEDRNKAYGAYELRKTYNRRITLALLITAGVALAIFIAVFVNRALEANKPAQLEVKEVVLEDIKQEKEEEEKKPEPPPPPPPKQEPPKVEMTKFTPPQIVKDEEVKKEDIPPEMEKVEETKIGVINQEGIKDEGLAAPPVVDAGKAVVEAPKPVEDESKVFEKVEVEAEFPGGTSAWARYLNRTLNGSVPVDNGAPEGSYTVIVQFIVDKAGAISDVKALTNHGYGMEEEAIRVIKKGPKWTPAIQNGRNVNAYRKQPITFVIAAQ